jgi:predicted ATP-grasp superfamily ATP-dependent carboligase
VFKERQQMKILIYEHVSGGGYAEQPLPPSVLAEGYAMLRGLIADFKAGGHETTVLLDERISRLDAPLDADLVIPVYHSEEPERFIKAISKMNDILYIIAPETSRILEEKVKLIEKTGKMSLNCRSNAISQVADKAILYETLQDMGFSIPKTLILNIDDATAELLQTIKKALKFPLVFKPVDGTSCSGLSVVRNDDQIEQAIAKIRQVTSSKCFIVQEFIDGASASVSLISNGKKAVPLSLNSQSLILSPPHAESRYEGGCVPFSHSLEQDAFVLAQKVVEAFPGLCGYVGVDVVLTQREVFVVDVNPRLTTSYVGLRQLGDFNIAQFLIDAAVEGKLPKKIKTCGSACFSKDEVPKPILEIFGQVAQCANIVSPPFPIESNAKACALVIGQGSDFIEAKKRLEEAKKNLQNIFL